MFFLILLSSVIKLEVFTALFHLGLKLERSYAMKQYKGYLIDLDGTMYRGTEEIAEAAGFIDKLRAKEYSLLICNE